MATLLRRDLLPTGYKYIFLQGPPESTVLVRQSMVRHDLSSILWVSHSLFVRLSEFNSSSNLLITADLLKTNIIWSESCHFSVTISAGDQGSDRYFKGFLLQARRLNGVTDQPIGRFLVPSSSRRSWSSRRRSGPAKAQCDSVSCRSTGSQSDLYKGASHKKYCNQ